MKRAWYSTVRLSGDADKPRTRAPHSPGGRSRYPLGMTETPHPPLPADDDEARFDDEASAVGHPEPAETEPHESKPRAEAGADSRMSDVHRQALLDSSATYVAARSAFTNAILGAQRAGMDDEEIARVTGLSVSMIRAVISSS